MTSPTPLGWYHEGTAFIVYGPIHSHHTTQAQAHSYTHSHPHLHSHHPTDHDHPASFWAIFRPTSTITVPSPPHSPEAQQQQPHDDNTFFFLQGTPYPWGSYPSDMDEPHGCMPPHLYYRVTICEHTKNDNTVTNNSNEWVLPYVHKIGDGNDEAGGLTTLYTLLRDQEDAEDNGVFIRTKIRHLQSSATGTYNNSPIPPSLYASTEILISERRTMDVIQRQFFSSSTTTSTSVINQGSYDLVPELREFQNHLQKTLQAVDTTETLPFSLVQSDLKLILPYHTPSSSTSST